MTKTKILEALGALNEKLSAQGTRAEICLYGGTAMVLAFNARLSTKDVDAIFRPKAAVRAAAGAVSQELGLQKDRLNDGVKGFTSKQAKFTAEDLPQFSNIQVTRPTASYLLAMKCMAARAPGYDTIGDRADIILLLRKLNLATETDALDLIERYYPRDRISPKSQFMILECLTEMGRETQ